MGGYGAGGVQISAEEGCEVCAADIACWGVAKSVAGDCRAVINQTDLAGSYDCSRYGVGGEPSKYV